MTKRFLLLTIFLLIIPTAYGQSQPPITIRESDGSPKLIQPTDIIVPNGTLSLTGRKATLAFNVLPANKPTSVALTDAVTVATNASLGDVFRVTLGGNRTLGNPTNPRDGQRIVWELIQDATGTRVITYDTKFAFGTDITGCVLTVTASKRDFLTAIYNSTADKFFVVGCAKGY